LSLVSFSEIEALRCPLHVVGEEELLSDMIVMACDGDDEIAAAAVAAVSRV
jgi:hypothetical protein